MALSAVFALSDPVSELHASEAEGAHKHFRRGVFPFSIVRANTISNRRTASPIFFRFGKFRPEFSVLIFQFRSMGIYIVPKCFIRFKSNLVRELELDCSGFSIYFISMAVTYAAAVQLYGRFRLGFLLFSWLICSLKQFAEGCFELLFNIGFELFLVVSDGYRIIGKKLPVRVF
nr:hypothetical protein [uncultured Parasutterella sp.]